MLMRIGSFIRGFYFGASLMIIVAETMVIYGLCTRDDDKRKDEE